MRRCQTIKQQVTRLTNETAKRVLIVEDEVLLAMQLEDMLTELGYDVVAQAMRITEAMELARDISIDFAVLDINVAGEESFPVADILCQRSIPFTFATGYGIDGLMNGYSEFPVLHKPYSQADLERTIAQVFRVHAQ